MAHISVFFKEFTTMSKDGADQDWEKEGNFLGTRKERIGKCLKS